MKKIVDRQFLNLSNDMNDYIDFLSDSNIETQYIDEFTKILEKINSLQESFFEKATAAESLPS